MILYKKSEFFCPDSTTSSLFLRKYSHKLMNFEKYKTFTAQDFVFDDDFREILAGKLAPPPGPPVGYPVTPFNVTV